MISASYELGESFRFQMQQFVHGECTSFTTLMEFFKYSVIHCLRLINSAQFYYKKF